MKDGMRKLSLNLSEEMAEGLENWATLANLTLSQALAFFVYIGIHAFLHSDGWGNLSVFNEVLYELEEKEVTSGREL